MACITAAPTTAIHSVATIWEAGQAEKEGVEIYSIGFGIGNNQNAIKTMKGIASAKTEDHYFSAGMSANDIGAVFNSIARQVSKYVAYNPIVIDTISNDFEYYTDSTLTASAGEGDKITRNGQTVTWDLAAEQLDTTEHTLTFYVKYKNIDNPAAPNTELPTNAGAQLKYAKEENGQATETQNIANASVPSLSKTVSYEVTGTPPKDYMKPDNAYVWAGQKHMVADTPETVNAEEGTYTFEGWKANGETVSGKLPITADITLTGEWKFEAAPTTKTITITKVWDNTVPIDQAHSATIVLTADGAVKETFTASLAAGATAKSESKTFEDLPVKNEATGQAVVYAVRETVIDGADVNGTQATTSAGTWNVAYGQPSDNTITVTNSFEEKERLDVTTTKTATRTRGDEPVVLPNNGTVRVGDTITYSVTFENTGNTALGKYGVLNGVEEFLGQGSMEYELKGQKVTVGNANNGGRPHTFKIADINEFAPNAKITYVFTYEVTEADETAGTITNKAYAKTSVLNPGATIPSTKFFPTAKHEVTVK